MLKSVIDWLIRGKRLYSHCTDIHFESQAFWYCDMFHFICQCCSIVHVGVWAIFSRAKPSLRKKYFGSAQKNCYANQQNCFAWLIPPNYLLLVKILDFTHFISLYGMNSVFFRLINTKNTFFLFVCWLLPQKAKKNGFTQLRGAAARAPPLTRLVRLW